MLPENLISQVVVLLCFILLIVVLFFDEQDYLSFSVLFLMVSTIVSSFDLADPPTLDEYIVHIDWEVIFFLIAMFTIVEILNEAKIFHEIARWIVKRFQHNLRLMFYAICLISTLSATILEDLSVAIIFIPVIILTCQQIKVNPAPFLYGMTICINLAGMLTPFGSAQNIMIANEFELTLGFFITNIGLYFVLATAITLFLLDLFVLKKSIKKGWQAKCDEDGQAITSGLDQGSEEIVLELERPTRAVMAKNLVALGVFVLMLFFIHSIHVAGLLGLLIFVFVNAEKNEKGVYHPTLSRYLRKVDYKLIYFFMCLYLLVYLMDINGTIAILERWIENLAIDNIFLLSVLILVLTSVFSGFLDNAPVTIMFIPIIRILTDTAGFAKTPLIIAFLLGINLGGNFLPQGSAADMMTLELSQQYCVEDVNYKRLTALGGLFALLHVVLGIGYLAALVYLFPV